MKNNNIINYNYFVESQSLQWHDFVELGILGTIKFVHVHYWLKKRKSLMQNMHSPASSVMLNPS